MASDQPISAEPLAPQRQTLLDYIENNPVAALLQGLAIGFAVGMIVRLLDSSRDKEKVIDVKHKPSLDEAKFHLGSLVLPFLWPAWQKAQETYGKSADSISETFDKAKEKARKTDFKKEGKKRLSQAEDWAEQEAEVLAKLGTEKAKAIEKWVEDEILPAAEKGWKKLRKYLS